MAYRSRNSSTSGSRSPSPSPPSNVSPTLQTVSLPPSTMVPIPPDEGDSSPRAVRNAPNRQPIDISRTQPASKGGCWTCRLRRKKCDEQREGDSCRTCLRLTIDCLGWGPKRPEWMRDKQAVEAYKANIKAQLTRAGLIRGQPRSSILQANSATAVAAPTQTRTQPYRRPSTASIATSSAVKLDPEYGHNYLDPPQAQNHHHHQYNMISTMPSSSTSSFQHIPPSQYDDLNVNSMDFSNSMFQYSPQSPAVSSSTTPLTAEHLNFDYSQFGGSQEHAAFDYDLRPPSPPPPPFPALSGQNSIQGDHVIYYFEHVRKIQYLFAGNTFTNVTYSLIVQEPRGAVTNAVCALASLHFTRMRVAQGLEAPDPNPEHSNATYFHGEACFQLTTGKQVRGSYSESDVIAALHLVSFSQLSGCVTDWQSVFAVACDWLAQTGLPTNENPKLMLRHMSATGQLAVKAILWLDIFSSFTLMRPPRYLALCTRLFSDRGVYWTPGNEFLRMDTLTGCPDEVILAIAEVSTLSHWKANERLNGTLSFRELIRRGDAIEQRLRQHDSAHPSFGEMDPAPLHPNLLHTTAIADLGPIPFPTDEMRQLVANIFRETVVLYLHTVLSDANPGVPEISASADVIVQLLNQLPPSELDRALVFPICLAGCMTNDMNRREFFKGRLQHLDQSIGNLMQTRLLMETVWHKRDIHGGAVDLRDTIRECSLNLLLV